MNYIKFFEDITDEIGLDYYPATEAEFSKLSQLDLAHTSFSDVMPTLVLNTETVDFSQNLYEFKLLLWNISNENYSSEERYNKKHKELERLARLIYQSAIEKHPVFGYNKNTFNCTAIYDTNEASTKSEVVIIEMKLNVIDTNNYCNE